MGTAENYRGLHRSEDRTGPYFVSNRAYHRELHADMDHERMDTCICRACVYFGARRFWKARV